PALRHVREAAPEHEVGPNSRDLLAAEDDTATLRTQEADDRLERGGLPGAVGADHGHDLPHPDAQRDAVQDVDRAVAPDELVGGEKLRAHTAARLRHGSATEVRFDDALVGLDHARRPLGDLLAVVQHEDGLAEPHDDLHVVLDEQDGLAAVAELTDGLEEVVEERPVHARGGLVEEDERRVPHQDRKSTRLNSSHVAISYAVFCLKKKKR